MNCADAYRILELALTGPVEATSLAAAREHAVHCRDCRALLQATRGMRSVLGRVPPPPRDEVDAARQRIFGALRADEIRRRRWRPRAALAGAAMILAAFSGLSGWWLLGVDGQEPDVVLTADSDGQVGLLLESSQELKGARIILEAPERIAFRDHPESRRLAFETDLASGRNYLEIPVTAERGGGGCLLARIEHEARSSEMCVEIQVDDRSTDTPLTRLPEAWPRPV